MGSAVQVATMRRKLVSLLSHIDAVCAELNASLAAVVMFLSALFLTMVIIRTVEHAQAIDPPPLGLGQGIIL
jgi:hypothetical protein